MPPGGIKSEPRLDEVKRELQAIIDSPAFCHSVRQTKLLEYLCNKVLLGESDHIKATTIAIEVFGRPWDFDDSKDAIVRVEAHRLRRKLAKYYEQEGAKSHLRIVLPQGRYIPEFLAGDQNLHSSSPAPVNDPSRGTPDGPQSKPESPIADRPVEAPSRNPAGTFRGRSVLLLASGGLALAALVAFVLMIRGGTARQNGTSAQIPSSASAVVPGPVVRILAGQTKAPYMDRFGRQWGPDRYFSGGQVEPGPKEFYGRPPDAGLYAMMRTGEFSYNVPVPPGEYELRLYWAEPIFRLANESNGGGENERRFNISINGQRVLEAFDVVADSGTSAVDVRAFRAITPARDGLVHIQFTASYGTPFLNGLELLPTTPGRTVPVRIRAHDLSFTDHEGNVWSPDNYYIGGRLATHKQTVAGTPDPELYGGERYGNFSYSIPVPPGKYAVTLHFAETWFRPDSDGQDNGGKGTRIFDVYCNGTTLLKDFDVFAKVGPFRAVARTYHGIRPNGQGKILLTFSPTKNYAAVKAIQVIDEP